MQSYQQGEPLEVDDSSIIQHNQEVKKQKRSWKATILVIFIILVCFALAARSCDIYKFFTPSWYVRPYKFYPDLHIPIHFTWLGQKPLLKKYVQRLKKLDFPYKLLGEKDYEEFKDFFDFDQNMSVSKRNDAFRLRYMWKYGGIYADLDYVINYQCLMMKFQGLEGTYYILDQDERRAPSSNLFYASKPGDPILDQVTQLAHQRQNEPTVSFLFTYLFENYGDKLKSIDLDECVYHQFDASWVEDDPNPW